MVILVVLCNLYLIAHWEIRIKKSNSTIRIYVKILLYKTKNQGHKKAKKNTKQTNQKKPPKNKQNNLFESIFSWTKLKNESFPSTFYVFSKTPLVIDNLGKGTVLLLWQPPLFCGTKSKKEIRECNKKNKYSNLNSYENLIKQSLLNFLQL